MSFKGNFILWIVVELLWFGLQLCFVSIVFSQTSSVGTWTNGRWCCSWARAISSSRSIRRFFLTNCTNLSELDPHGQNGFFAAPAGQHAFHGLAAQVDFGAFVNALFAVGVMLYRREIAFASHAGQFAGFSALCAVGILIHYSLMFMLATISFWTVRAQGIVWGYYNLFNIARMPDEAFHGAFKAVFTFALPVLLVSNVPARVLADKVCFARVCCCCSLSARRGQ